MAMRTQLCVALAGLGFLAVLTAKPVVAHHAFNAEFDAKRPVKFKGTVTKMVWVNPHAWIYIDVKKADGSVEEWMVEAGTPNTLFRRGFTKQSLLAGTEITVDGYQSKDGSLRMNGRDITLPNGQTLFIGSSGTGAPSDEKPKK
jgi:uncharacterized protein DUF6152